MVESVISLTGTKPARGTGRRQHERRRLSRREL